MREALTAASFSTGDVAAFSVKVRQAYVASAKHISTEVSLSSSGLLKQLTCLQPENRKKSATDVKIEPDLQLFYHWM